ncbi:MAG TPA: universal stress protein [Jatrophihabitantaceae bacterium]|jgi:nucleotide-binding universal stress UspA family protein
MAKDAPERACDGPSTLVVGVDGSDTSWRALYYALGLARRQRTTVIAVHAAAVPTAVGGYDAIVVGAVETTNLQISDELQPAIRALASDYGVRSEFISRAGDPISTLTAIATERHADALIIGASHALIHRLLGSKATRAVRKCPCPVTVVP